MLFLIWFVNKQTYMLVVYLNATKAYSRPLPIIYQSNGEETIFRDFRDEDGELIELNRIHTPKEIVKMLGIDDPYAGLPTLKKKGLRDCQYEAISELENSFRNGQKKKR